MNPILTMLATISVGLMLTVSARAQKAENDPMDRVMADIQAGDSSKALVDLNEAIKLRPDKHDAYLLRCNFRALAGDFSGAMADIDRVIELKPDLGPAYYTRATVRMSQNDSAGAMKDLDSAVLNKYFPDHVLEMRAFLRS